MKHDEEMEKIAIQAEDIAAKERMNEDIQVTYRWKSDMTSDSWMSKNIRPLCLAALFLFWFIIVFFDSAIKDAFEVKQGYIDATKSLLDIVVIAYFSSRGAEKIVPILGKK